MLTEVYEIWQTHPMGEHKHKQKTAVARATDSMVVDTLGGRMHVHWDKSAQATPNGQLVFFAEFLACSGCGKTTQAQVPWAREGSGFTALFEALALSLCRELPVRQAAALLRCTDKQLWRRIEHYVDEARSLDDMPAVRVIGIDGPACARFKITSPWCMTLSCF